MDSFEWVCIKNKDHVYDTVTAERNSYFCPQCAYGEGILIKKPVSNGQEGYNTLPEGARQKSKANRIIEPDPFAPMDDLGLCIMLLDCSGSMWEPAFDDHPMLKKDLIANSVSAGIFSLSGNPLKEYAYVLILGFDHKIDTLVPYTSIKNLVEEYGDVSKLEQALKDKMEKKKGATDINGALEAAFKFTQQFINSEITALGEYKPRIQMVLDDDLMNHQIPNVRVLLFTDGGQYMGDGKTKINASPFKKLEYDGKVIDLLMGAYYGTSEDSDYHKLKELVSKCPRHPEVDQFFLFDEPNKLTNLKGLFRMASGASGFCPTCLEEATTVVREI
ncbi:MAG: VWA domain-containing protein [Ferruginibacter sp.]